MPNPNKPKTLDLHTPARVEDPADMLMRRITRLEYHRNLWACACALVLGALLAVITEGCGVHHFRSATRPVTPSSADELIARWQAFSYPYPERCERERQTLRTAVLDDETFAEYASPLDPEGIRGFFRYAGVGATEAMNPRPTIFVRASLDDFMQGRVEGHEIAHWLITCSGEHRLGDPEHHHPFWDVTNLL